MTGLIDKITRYVKPKRHFAGFQSIIGNPLIWVSFTLLILVLAFLALRPVGLQPTSNELNQPKRTYSKIRVDVPQTMDIGQSDDELRAEQYRAEQIFDSVIENWMTQAQELRDAGQLVEPQGYNAWFAYQQALKLDPDNHKAKAGLGNIETIIYDNIEQSYAQKDYKQTEFWLKKFDIIAPEQAFQKRVREQIELQRLAIEKDKQAELIAEQNKEKITQLENEITQFTATTPIALGAIVDRFTAIIQLDAEYKLNDTIQTELLDKVPPLIETDIDNRQLEQANEKIASLKLLGIDDALQAIDLKMQQAEQAEKNRQEQELARAQSILNANSNASVSSDSSEDGAQTQANTTVDINSAITENKVLVEDLSITQTDAQLLKRAMEAFYIRDDYAEAARLFAPLAARNNIRARFYLGLIDLHIINTEIDNNTAQTWLSTSALAILEQAHQGNAWAQFDSGLAYDYGLTFRRDSDLASKWYSQAREQGYSLDSKQISRFFPKQGVEVKK